MNLKKIYDKINKSLDKLYDYENYSGHIDLVNEISEYIDLLGAYFGVRILKMDIGPFKKNEKVLITQDESGAWVNAIDDNDKRVMDLFDYLESNIDDWFYPIPEPPVDVNQLLTGEKSVDEIAVDAAKRANYLISKEIFDF